MTHVCAEHFERALKHRGGRNAIRVVVAMNHHALAALDRLVQSGHSRPHVGQQERVMQVGQARVEKALCFVRIGQATLVQQPREHRRQAEGRGQS